MIGRIKGILLEKKPQEVLVDVNGLGYEVHVPLTTSFQLPEPGAGVLLYTHLVVREDAQLLFGFHDERQRALFRLLIRVSGVGPKLAQAILSGIEADDFVAVVHKQDAAALTRLPGVGKKTAERLVMEVRDKLKEWDVDQSLLAGQERAPASGAGGHQQEAEAALVGLGYKPQEASRMVGAAGKALEEERRPLDSESLIRLALKNMGKK